MTIQSLLREYDLELEDVRWYLCSLLVDRFFTYKDNKRELIRFVWSGELESELYNMEERFLAKRQEDYDRNIEDEAHIRSLLAEIAGAKRKRYSHDTL